MTRLDDYLGRREERLEEERARVLEGLKISLELARRVVNNCKHTRSLSEEEMRRTNRDDRDLLGDPVADKLNDLSRLAYGKLCEKLGYKPQAFFGGEDEKEYNLTSGWVSRGIERLESRRMTEKEYDYLLNTPLETLYAAAVRLEGAARPHISREVGALLLHLPIHDTDFALKVWSTKGNYSLLFEPLAVAVPA